jgi:hypothetical protein
VCGFVPSKITEGCAFALISPNLNHPTPVLCTHPPYCAPNSHSCTVHPTPVLCTQLPYCAPNSRTVHSPPVLCTQLSYCAPNSRTVHPTPVLCTQLPYCVLNSRTVRSRRWDHWDVYTQYFIMCHVPHPCHVHHSCHVPHSYHVPHPCTAGRVWRNPWTSMGHQEHQLMTRVGMMMMTMTLICLGRMMRLM